MLSTSSTAKVHKLGDYELVRMLATGGMAEVYEARRIGPHGFTKKFAVKRILPQLATDLRLVQMFCDEARVHAALSHPNLVQVVDFGEERGELYIVMEYVDGLSCADLMTALVNRKRTVELGPALYIAREVLQGLEYVHSACDVTGRPLGLVHRDVGPNNILLGRAGDVKLTDFGIVRSALFDTRTAPGEVKGKIGYVSPEQAVGAALDARSDLFSLGVVLAEMLIGEPLFPGATELEILSSLHRGDLARLEQASERVPLLLHGTLRRALAHDPNERFSSAREFAEELDQAARSLGQGLGSHDFGEWLRDLGVLSIPSNVQEITRNQLPKPAALPAIKLVVGAIESDEPTVREKRRTGSAPPSDEHSEKPSGLRQSSRPDAAVKFSKVPSVPAVEYCVRRPGGTIVGPLSVSRIMEMIATARAGADTEVAPVGGHFQPIQALPEFERLATRPPYKFFEPVALMATERHPIEAASLAWHLFRIVAGRKTGLLCARLGREQKRIYFVDGAPSVSASTDPGELLGTLLLAEQKLDALALERALEIAFRDRQPLGQVLVGAGVLRPSELVRAVSAQRLRRLTSLLEWREGELFFLPSATSGEDAFALPSAPAKLIATAVRAAYGHEELSDLLSRIESELLEPRAAYHQQRAALELEAEEQRILERAAMGMRVKAVLADARTRGGEAERAAARALFLGLSSGAIGVRTK